MVFIPGQAANVLILKKAYLKQVPASIKAKRAYEWEIENCDQDYTKKSVATRPKKEIVRKVYIEKKKFTLGPTKEESFNVIKNAIANNVV